MSVGGSKTTWIVALLLGGLAIFQAHGWLLRGDQAALARDFGSIFLDSVIQQHRALQDGSLLLWDPSQLGGTPAWPLPNSATAYPPLLLAIALFGPITGLKLCVLAHIVFGALGVFVATRTLGGSRYGCLIAGVLFACAPFTQHLAYTLPFEVFGLAWLPWSLAALAHARTTNAWFPLAVAAGVAFAAQPWSGAYQLMTRGTLIIGLFGLMVGRSAWSLRGLGRSVLILTVFGLTFGCIALGRLYPMLEWVQGTNRAAGVSKELAMHGVIGFEQLMIRLQAEGVVALVIGGLGLLVGGYRRGDGRVPVIAAFVVVILLAMGPLHLLLYNYVPGFGFLREPQRALILMSIFVPLMAGLGWTHIALRLSGRTNLRMVVGFSAAALLLPELLWVPRYVPPRIDALSERLAANAIHQDLAERALHEPLFRVTTLEMARSRPKRNPDVLRAALGLQAIDGLVGNLSYPGYDVWLLAARDSPARLLGLMNGRYVTSVKPLDMPGLELVGEFEADPAPLHAGQDGPYLYRNLDCLPRAFLAHHALLQVELPENAHAAIWPITAWQPETTVLLRVDVDSLAEIDLRQLPPIDAAVTRAFGQLKQLSQAGIKASMIPSHIPALDGWLSDALSEANTPITPLEDPTPFWNACRIELPGHAGGKWLVLAETYAMHAGWSATVDGSSLPLIRANGVATAIPIPVGGRQLILEYDPPGMRVGVLISLLSLAVACLICGLGLRRLLTDRRATTGPS